MRLRTACSILVVALVLTVPAVADENHAPVPDNVLITFHVGTVEKGKDIIQKTYEMVVIADGESVDMATGARIPSPTTSFNVSDDGTRVGVPMTSYTYQQVGFSARVRTVVNPDG